MAAQGLSQAEAELSWAAATLARMVYWLNADNLDLLSHNINYPASSIPGVNKYFLLLCLHILIHYVGRLGVLGG